MTVAERELRRRGLKDVEERILRGKYYLSPRASEVTRWAKANSYQSRFCERLESDGWEIVDKPVVAKLRKVDEMALPKSSLYIPKATGGIWHPNHLDSHKIIPYDHPWCMEKPDMDIWMVWVWARREAQTGTIEVPDATLENLIEKRDPVLRGIVIE